MNENEIKVYIEECIKKQGKEIDLEQFMGYIKLLIDFYMI